jgi:RNA polymerase sigma-70 factor (ECF subfamily)
VKDVGVTDASHAAIELLYRQEGERLWRAVFAYAHDRQVADDAVAEAFAQAIRRGDAIRDPARWVWTAAFRIANGELAGRRRLREVAPREGSYEMRDPEDEIVRALERLSPKQRAPSSCTTTRASRRRTSRGCSDRPPRR